MTFEELSLGRETLKAVKKMGFEEPTPIQVSAIPPIMRGLDIVGQAQTGTGKTAAFGIPIVEKCEKRRRPFAIILEPTRELAIQVAQEMNRIGKYEGVRVLPVYGGKSIETQIKALRQGVDVIVGTPGRVIDHLNRKTVSLAGIKIAVLDEADEMLNMGFIDDVETILRAVPEERQTLLFSATMPQPIVAIAKRHMRNPEKIRGNTKDVVVPKIKQVFYEIREGEKIEALSRLLDVEDPERVLVFCHTKRDVDDVAMKLQEMGYNASAIHGDFPQSRRDEVMERFRRGVLDILVATDVAARGLDIKDVSHVINYGMPQNSDSYVHRIGRTGRAGRSGMAITFVTPREYRHLRLIEKSARTVISKKKLPSSGDVINARTNNVVKSIAGIINKGKNAGYREAIQKLSKGYDMAEIAAAALYAAYGELNAQPSEGVYEGPRTARLFMTLGRKDKIQVGDIIKSIVSEANIPHGKIGDIRILDHFTFVEVPEDLAERIIQSVSDTVVKGKRVKVRQAKPQTALFST